MINTIFVPFMKSVWHRSWCWHSGWRVEGLCGLTVVGTANKVTHKEGCLDPCPSAMEERAFLENWIKEVQICLGLHCRCNLSALNLVIVKRGKKDIPGLTDPTLSHHLKPERAGRSRKPFNLSKEDKCSPICCEKALNKEGQKPQTKAPKTHHLVTPCVLQHKH